MGAVGCPTPQKRGYVDAMTANVHYRRLLRIARAKGDPKAELLNQYVCECGLWHIGHTGRRQVAS